MSRIYYGIILKRNLDLKNPKSFNEKLQWFKLFYWHNNEKATEICKRIIRVWESAQDIDRDSLPNQFVLKCNHGCGYNIICLDKSKLNIEETKKQLDRCNEGEI